MKKKWLSLHMDETLQQFSRCFYGRRKEQEEPGAAAVRTWLVIHPEGGSQLRNMPLVRSMSSAWQQDSELFQKKSKHQHQNRKDKSCFWLPRWEGQEAEKKQGHQNTQVYKSCKKWPKAPENCILFFKCFQRSIPPDSPSKRGQLAMPYSHVVHFSFSLWCR